LFILYFIGTKSFKEKKDRERKRERERERERQKMYVIKIGRFL